MHYLDRRIERLKRTYEQYAVGLAEVAGVRLPGFDIPGGEVPQWVDAVVEQRDELDRFLTERAMLCRRFWFPLHTQAPYRRPDAEFPGSTWAGSRALWLPSAFTLTDADVKAVIDAVLEFAGRQEPAAAS